MVSPTKAQKQNHQFLHLYVVYYLSNYFIYLFIYLLFIHLFSLFGVNTTIELKSITTISENNGNWRGAF